MTQMSTVASALGARLATAFGRGPELLQTLQPVGGGSLVLSREVEADLVEVRPLEAEPVGASPLRRYLPWQWRDFWKARGLLMLALAGLAVWRLHASYHPMLGAQVAKMRQIKFPTEPEQFRSMIDAVVVAASFVGTLIATVGLISRDRERGLQRFLFSKPISRTGYYLQSFAVNGVGFLLAMAAMLGLTSLVFMRTVPLTGAMTLAAAMYALVGGLVFLLSTLVRFDAVVAGVLCFVGLLVQDEARRGRPWAVAITWLLPPVAPLGTAMSLQATSLGMALALAWGYGAAYVAAGVAVLRKRSIIS